MKKKIASIFSLLLVFAISASAQSTNGRANDPFVPENIVDDKVVTLTNDQGVEYNMTVYKVHASPITRSTSGGREFTVRYAVTTDDMELSGPATRTMSGWDQTGSVEFFLDNLYSISTINGEESVLLKKVTASYLIHQTGVTVSNLRASYGCSNMYKGIFQTYYNVALRSGVAHNTNYTKYVPHHASSTVGSFLTATLKKGTSTWALNELRNDLHTGSAFYP